MILAPCYYDRVIEMIAVGDDPLGIGRTEDYEVVKTAVLAALRGADRIQSTALVASMETMMALQDRDHVGIDIITARLIAHLGVDPLTLAWLAMDGDDLHLKIADGVLIDHQTDDDPMTPATTIHLGNGRWWESKGVVTIDEVLPDSVLAASIGRPLATLVSHPVLDAHDLVIADAHLSTIQASSPFVVVKVDRPAEQLTPDDLAKIKPEGIRHDHAE